MLTISAPLAVSLLRYRTTIRFEFGTTWIVRPDAIESTAEFIRFCSGAGFWAPVGLLLVQGIHTEIWLRPAVIGFSAALACGSSRFLSRPSFLTTASMSERFFSSSACTAMSCWVGAVRAKLKLRWSAGVTRRSPRERVTTSLPETS